MMKFLFCVDGRLPSLLNTSETCCALNQHSKKKRLECARHENSRCHPRNLAVNENLLPFLTPIARPHCISAGCEFMYWCVRAISGIPSCVSFWRESVKWAKYARTRTQETKCNVQKQPQRSKRRSTGNDTKANNRITAPKRRACHTHFFTCSASDSARQQ